MLVDVAVVLAKLVQCVHAMCMPRERRRDGETAAPASFELGPRELSRRQIISTDEVPVWSQIRLRQVMVERRAEFAELEPWDFERYRTARRGARRRNARAEPSEPDQESEPAKMAAARVVAPNMTSQIQVADTRVAPREPDAASSSAQPHVVGGRETTSVSEDASGPHPLDQLSEASSGMPPLVDSSSSGPMPVEAAESSEGSDDSSNSSGVFLSTREQREEARQLRTPSPEGLMRAVEAAESSEGSDYSSSSSGVFLSTREQREELRQEMQRILRRHQPQAEPESEPNC